jgi:hypothetical protein
MTADAVCDSNGLGCSSLGNSLIQISSRFVYVDRNSTAPISDCGFTFMLAKRFMLAFLLQTLVIQSSSNQVIILVKEMKT